MEREYSILKAWCEEPRIGCLCPSQDVTTKVINRFWEELHYHQAGELDDLIEALEGREHISPTKEAALKRLRPQLEKIFGSENKLTDPEFVVRDRQRSQQRAAKKGQSSALELDESTKEETVMDTEATPKKKAKKPAVTKKEEPAARGGVGLADIAKKMKVDPADLRRVLRSSKIKKPAGSWNWPKGHADLKAVEKLASSMK